MMTNGYPPKAVTASKAGRSPRSSPAYATGLTAVSATSRRSTTPLSCDSGGRSSSTNARLAVQPGLAHHVLDHVADQLCGDGSVRRLTPMAGDRHTLVLQVHTRQRAEAVLQPLSSAVDNREPFFDFRQHLHAALGVGLDSV